MENKLIVINQERKEFLKALIAEHHASMENVLIFSPYAEKLSRIKYTNIFIAPDSKRINYEEKVLEVISEQNQIYYPIYIKLKKLLDRLIPANNKIQLETFQ